MIPQKPITDPKEITTRIMKHHWRDWDINSPAWRYWLRWAKKNFATLKKMKWQEIYKLSQTKMDEEDK